MVPTRAEELTCTKDSQIRHRPEPPPRLVEREDPEQDQRPPSKSQRKRDMHELQELGEQLVALPGHRLARLPIEESLRDAITLAQRTTSHEGRRRQLQYIGKLMRGVDAAPIRAALDLHNDGSRASNALLHGAEGWRKRLLEEKDAAALWLKAHPATNTALLQAQITGAKTELANGAGGRHYRELFRLLRDTLAAAALPPSAIQRPLPAPDQGTGQVVDESDDD